MNMRDLSLLPVLISLTATALAGGGGVPPPQFPMEMIRSQHVGMYPLSLNLEIHPTLAREKKGLLFSATLANKSAQNVTVYMGLKPISDFIVRDSQGNSIWECLHGQTFSAISVPYVIHSKQALKFTCLWNGQTNDGKLALPGTYTAEAVISTSDEQVQFAFRSALYRFQWR